MFAGEARHGEARRGAARRGEAWRGVARLGEARRVHTYQLNLDKLISSRAVVFPSSHRTGELIGTVAPVRLAAMDLLKSTMAGSWSVLTVISQPP